MEPSTLFQNIEWKYSEINEWQSITVSTAKVHEFFGPILSKNPKISNVHNFGNTGLIFLIPTLLSSEAWDLSPYKISWILARVRWNIPIVLDHLTWNDPKLLICPSIFHDEMKTHPHAKKVQQNGHKCHAGFSSLEQPRLLVSSCSLLLASEQRFKQNAQGPQAI